ncbi:MAG: hypothetical protein ROZ09_11555 [Thiobacillus sp.]|jgi:hypothetical protein|uniref:hypothetical protein n=1 Tax=Thiobacillus sp. TaxID=924 RepID=UPI002894A44A|nr:hypothetical protein [Thiobacillus sp.]MDT3707455.1 hypothetical protein [Thiobacillus sp.]
MSGIDNAKKGMGWKAQNERAACRNCKRAEFEKPISVDRAPSLRCTPGGFYTQPYAICDQWADWVGVRG